MRQEPGTVTVRLGRVDIHVPAITAAQLGLRTNQRIDADMAAKIEAAKSDLVFVAITREIGGRDVNHDKGIDR